MTHTLTEEDKQYILQHQNESAKAIGETLGFTAKTVNKYRKHRPLRVWNEATIENEINRVLPMFGDVTHFPSAGTLRKNGLNYLGMAISNHGGFKYWAEKFHLPQIKSETFFGKKYEQLINDYLTNKLKVKVIQMSAKFPYDLLVNGTIKVDVKAGMEYKGRNSVFYTFNLETSHRKSDFVIACCVADNETIDKIYIIPSIILEGKTQLSVGKTKSKYDDYLYDISTMQRYLEFYDSIKYG